mmetsp:Transcript_14657/g.22371  ORF Transcript_14657/g.22371 Transcript_14657/m.22371 type:complete len:162 (-) Transcript_14657:71-556(-)
MGQKASIESNEMCLNQEQNASNETEHSNEKSKNIRQLIDYAKSNYHENPTEALAAQALQLNSGSESTDIAMARLRDELGDDIADHIGSRHQRVERALKIIENLLQDESTILFEDGRQDLLRQTVEDGSSVVCSRCNDVVASSRWQQHQDYWCQAIAQDEDD